jgi:hypothetical protein
MSKAKSHSQGPYPHQTGNPDEQIRHRDGVLDPHPGSSHDGFLDAPNHHPAVPETEPATEDAAEKE